MFYDNQTLTKRKRNRNFRHVTFVFRGDTGSLMSIGLNEIARYTVEHLKLRKHSEEVALRKAYNKYRNYHRQLQSRICRSGIVVVNGAFTANGNIRQSRPCTRCCSTLTKSEIPIKNVIWFDGLTCKFTTSTVNSISTTYSSFDRNERSCITDN